jgi:hypothetical protein
MADGNTPTYSLILPEIDGADGTWGVSLNTNLGSLDSLLSGGTALTAISVSGDVAAATVTVGDSTGTNLQLYEDSSQNAIIKQRGTGGLQITGVNGSLANDDQEQLVTWDSDNVNLSWQGTTGAGTKLSTTETGIDVTGTVNAQSTVVITDPNPSLILKDSSDSDDHSIKFRGSDDVDNLQITSTSNHLNFITADSNKNILMKPNGTTALQVDTTGITVTGKVEADAFTGHMTSVVSSSAQTIATTSYGVRKIHTGGAVSYTFDATGTISGNDIGKAIVIANAGTDTITCNFTTSKFYKMISGVDADLSGSGLASITIAKGGVAEIVITETNKALVFGAGVA